MTNRVIPNDHWGDDPVITGRGSLGAFSIGLGAAADESSVFRAVANINGCITRIDRVAQEVLHEVMLRLQDV